MAILFHSSPVCFVFNSKLLQLYSLSTFNLGSQDKILNQTAMEMFINDYFKNGNSTVLTAPPIDSLEKCFFSKINHMYSDSLPIKGHVLRIKELQKDDCKWKSKDHQNHLLAIIPYLQPYVKAALTVQNIQFYKTLMWKLTQE